MLIFYKNDWHFMNVAQFLKVQINLFFQVFFENWNFLIIIEISYYFEVFSKKNPEIIHKKGLDNWKSYR